MSDVDFLENNEFYMKERKYLGEYESNGIVSALMKTGIVKEEKTAKAIVLVVLT